MRKILRSDYRQRCWIESLRFGSKVATQEVNTDKDRVFSPHTKKEVPRESLAVRLGRSRKEGY